MHFKKSKKNIVKLIILILSILGITLSFTWAFLTSEIGSGSSTSVDLASYTTDKFIFTPGSSISISATESNLNTVGTDLVGSTSFSAYLRLSDDPENTVNSISKTYNGYVTISNNNYEYTTNNNTPELVLQIQKPDGTYVSSIEGLTSTTYNNNPAFDITTKNGTITFTTGYSIVADTTGTTQTWNAKVVLKALSTDQTLNEGKTFNADFLLVANELDNNSESTRSVYAYTIGRNLTDYKIYGNTIQSNLPDGFTQVEYILSNGSGQYIDTGIPANNDNLSFAIKYQFNAVTSGAYQYVVGAYTIASGPENYNTVRLLQYGTDRMYLNVNTKASGGTTTYYVNRNANTIYEETLSSTKFTSNGTTLNITNTTKGTAYTGNVLLFKSSPTATSAYANVKLYYFKVYDDGVLVRDYVPCYTTVNGSTVIGLYDLVNHEFYTNKGSNSFTKGADVTNVSPDTPMKLTSVGEPDYELPSEYQKIEYIESDGNSYIDTGFKLTGDSKIEVDFQTAPTIPTNAATVLFYSGSSSSASAISGFILGSSGYAGKYSVLYGNQRYNSSVALSGSTRYLVTLDKNYLYVNDELINTFTKSTFTTPYSMPILAQYYNDTTGKNFASSGTRLYSVKIWNKDAIVRYLVPVYRKSDNEVGMYDYIHKVFYTNAGAGKFTKGNNTGNVEIPIIISGKNLMDYNTPRTVTDINLNGTISRIDVSVPAGKTITVSADVDATNAGGDTNGVSLVLYYEDDTSYTYNYWDAGCVKIPKGEIGRSYTTVTATKNIKRISFTGHAFNASNGGTTVFSNYQIEIGNLTNYEPYVSQTTKIYLDEPLRKVGNYADYIDFANQKVVRKVGIYNFTGEEEWVQHTSLSSGGVYRVENVFNILLNAPITSTYMTHFKFTNVSATANWSVGWYRSAYSTINDVQVVANSRVYVSTKHTTLESFKSWVAGNNVKYYYPLTTPVEERLAIPSIPTYNGSTYITVDTDLSPSNFVIDYIEKN